MTYTLDITCLECEFKSFSLVQPTFISKMSRLTRLIIVAAIVKLSHSFMARIKEIVFSTNKDETSAVCIYHPISITKTFVRALFSLCS